MSAADVNGGWDFTVPEGDAELLAELRRHGVAAGQRLRIVTTEEPDTSAEDSPPRQRRLAFAGMIKDAPADLATNMDRYMEGFGER